MQPELAPLVAPGARSGVFLDFDGTLSEIVPEASEARPLPQVREILTDLTERVHLVAVVSGRSAAQLLEWLGPQIEIWGVHGAERSRNGIVEVDDRLQSYLSLMRSVREEAEDAVGDWGDPGVAVEDKKVVLTLHYRRARDRAAAERMVRSLAQRLAANHGVTQEPGRASIELRPPVELSKAQVVTRRAREEDLNAAMFVGDDTGDLPAFRALEELRAQGAQTVKVVARSDESPPALLDAADVVVDGPRGAVELLGELAHSRP
jgi:trehalose 6-phosphate phosphatase